MRRILSVVITCLSGLVVLASYFVASEPLERASDLLVEAAAFLGAVALLIGVSHLAVTHGRRALRREGRGTKAKPGYSAVLVIALVGTFALGVLLPGSASLAWIFDHLYMPLQAAMTALLAFSLVSGAYRAFRVDRNGASVLLGVSLFMLLAQLPLSQRLSPYIPALREWLLSVPVTAGVRGILLGSSLGILAASLRILVGIDRPQASE